MSDFGKLLKNTLLGGKNKKVLTEIGKEAAEDIADGLDILADANGVPRAAQSMGDIAKGAEGAGVAIRGFGTSVLTAGKAIGTFLLTNPIGWLIDLAGVIYLVVKAYDYFNISVEEATEYLDGWNSKIDESKSKIKTQKDLAKEAKESYNDLAKGVNTLTNANINLSDEDYKKFIDLNNRLAEQFPELRTGLDDEKNAIIKLGDNALETAKKLDEVVARQERIANIEISDNLPKTFENTKVILDDNDKQNELLEKEIQKYNDSLEQLNKLKELSQEDLVFKGLDQNSYEYINNLNKSYDQFLNTIDDYDKKMNYEMLRNQTEGIYDANGNLMYDYVLSLSQLDPDDYTRLQSIFEENLITTISNIQDSISEKEFAIENNSSSTNSYWEAYLNDNVLPAMHSKYQYMNFSQEGQKIADALVSGMTVEMSNQMDEENPYQFIQDNIVRYIDELENVDLTSLTGEKLSVADLFSGELSNEELINLYNQIQAFFDGKGIKVSFTVGEVAKETDNEFDTHNNSITGYGSNLGDRGYSTTTGGNSDKILEDQQKINEVTKDFTTEQKKEWMDVTKGCKTADEAISKWKKHVEEAKDAGNKMSDAFTRREMIATINSMSDGFDVLDQIYADVKDGGTFDFTKLDTKKFEEAFKGLETEYEDFIETVSKSPKDIKKCQKAFNNLATAYIKNSGAMDNLNDENADVAVAMLKNMGIVNAEEVVLNRLAVSNELNALNTGELANATYDEIIASEKCKEVLEAESNAAEGQEAAYTVAQQAMAQFALSKISANGVTINTSADIDNVIALANAAGASVEVIKELNRVRSIIAASEASGGAVPQDVLDDAYATLDKINNGTYDFNFQLDPDVFKYGGADQSNKAGKEAADAYVEAFEKELKKLQEMRDAGVISEREYLERLKALYIQYFADRKKYITQFKKYEKEYLEGKQFCPL